MFMGIDEKYNEYKKLFYKYFIKKAYHNVKGSNIPLSLINLDNLYGEMGDGTINLSLYMQYIYTEYVLDNVGLEDLVSPLGTLQRLIDSCYELFVKKFPGVYFKFEDGFFLRDDVSSDMASDFNLNYINTGYSTGIERINEDPCFSPFTSQDQIWHLIPILRFLLYKGIYNNTCSSLGKNITGYVVKNKHIIYNPYYSALYHNWTYLHIFEPFSQRIAERNSKLKYTIKVKRGANNWYLAYGFKKAYNRFGGKCKTFLSSLWYKPFIFLADRIYHPYICKWFKLPVKNTSYYSLGEDAWYNNKFEDRLIKKFNESLKTSELFMPQLVFLTKNRHKINLDLVEKWLNNYPEVPKSGIIKSPLEFMIIYNWYNIIKNELQ